MIKKLEEILQKERERLPSLREIDRRKLKEVTKKVDAVLETIETSDITTTNDCSGYRFGGSEERK